MAGVVRQRPQSAGAKPSSLSSSPPSSSPPRRIAVMLRKRPLMKAEVARSETDVVSVEVDEASVVVHETKTKVDLTKYEEQHTFVFDNVFAENSDNEEVYRVAARPLLDHMLNRGKVTCFAYGQTGSGKTYTMGPMPERTAQDLFVKLRDRSLAHLGVWVSYFEIYMGTLYDLLNERRKLVIREDAKRNVCVIGLQEHRVESIGALRKMMDYGNSARTTGTTSANVDSSRSHAILQISVKDKLTNRTEGRFSFIDLAGNERGADTYDNAKQTRLEGAEINKSLLALKECIRALDQSHKHIPFRGSILTEVLKDSFIGNSRTCMVATITPTASCTEYTLNTLRYADRLRELKKKKLPTPLKRPQSMVLSSPFRGVVAEQSCLHTPRRELNQPTTTKLSLKTAEGEDEDEDEEGGSDAYLVPPDVASLFTSKQLRAIQRAFAFCDLDEDGVVTTEELWFVFNQLGVLIAGHEVIDIVDKLGSPGDGTIDFKCFVKGFLEGGPLNGIFSTDEKAEEKDEPEESDSSIFPPLSRSRPTIPPLSLPGRPEVSVKPTKANVEHPVWGAVRVLEQDAKAASEVQGAQDAKIINQQQQQQQQKQQQRQPTERETELERQCAEVTARLEQQTNHVQRLRVEAEEDSRMASKLLEEKDNEIQKLNTIIERLKRQHVAPSPRMMTATQATPRGIVGDIRSELARLKRQQNCDEAEEENEVQRLVRRTAQVMEELESSSVKHINADHRRKRLSVVELTSLSNERITDIMQTIPGFLTGEHPLAFLLRRLLHDVAMMRRTINDYNEFIHREREDRANRLDEAFKRR